MENHPMRPLEGNPADAEHALRAVLQALALEPARQRLLFREPRECVTCRISSQHRELLARYGNAPFFQELSKAKATVLYRVEEAARKAGECPCHEPQLLKEAGFVALRKQATAALKAFGWGPGEPDPGVLWGRKEYAKRLKAEADNLRRQRLASRAKTQALEDFSDIPDFDPRGLTLDAFRQRVDDIPWFSRLGQPHARDQYVDRITDWDDWPGPESRGGSAMAQEAGRWCEDLLALPEPGREAIQSLWSSVENQALRPMPLEIKPDPWHGPTAAATQAAWLAATIASCLLARVPIPPNALSMWAWFARGHWPCTYSEDDDLPVDKHGNFIQKAVEQARLVVF